MTHEEFKVKLQEMTATRVLKKSDLIQKHEETLRQNFFMFLLFEVLRFPKKFTIGAIFFFLSQAFVWTYLPYVYYKQFDNDKPIFFLGVFILYVLFCACHQDNKIKALIALRDLDKQSRE